MVDENNNLIEFELPANFLDYVFDEVFFEELLAEEIII